MSRDVLLALAHNTWAVQRRAFRRPGVYVMWAVALTAMVGIQHFTGLGAATSGPRPGTQGSALALLAGLLLSVLTAGALGPVWSVNRVQAQWVVTAPGGAVAVITWRLLGGLLARFGETIVLVPLAQLVTGHRPNWWVAVVLAIWYAGLALTSSGARYGAAALYARSAHKLIARAALTAVVGGGFLLLTQIPAAMTALGRPGTGGGAAALLSAGAWLLTGVLVAVAGIAKAEHLVTDAIAAGDVSARMARPKRLERTKPTREPESFRLTGASAFAWQGMTIRRRHLFRRLVLYSSPVYAVTVAVALLRPEWAPAVPGLMAAGMLLGASGSPSPGPLVADGRLLPVSVRSVAVWKVLLGTYAQASSLGAVWLIPLLLHAGDPALLAVGSICLVPICLVGTVIGWTRSPAGETPLREFQYRLAKTSAIVAVGLGIVLLRPGPVGGAIAAGWLVLAGVGLLMVGVWQIESTLRPATR